MSKKDTIKQDLRSILLKDGTVKATSYVAGSGSRLSKEDSMKAAIAARRSTFAVKKEGV